MFAPYNVDRIFTETDTKTKLFFRSQDGTCDTTAFVVVPLQRVNVVNVFAFSAVLWNVPFSTVNMIHYSWWVTLFCSSWKLVVRQAQHNNVIFTVSVKEKSLIHQITNKRAFSDIRCQAGKITLNLDSGSRDKMADWSHKHLKITSEAQAHLFSANIWKVEAATCVNAVQQEYFLSGGNWAAYNMTGVTKNLKPAGKRDCRTTFISLNFGNIEPMGVCPDGAHSRSRSGSSFRGPAEHMEVTSFTHPLADPSTRASSFSWKSLMTLGWLGLSQQ